MTKGEERGTEPNQNRNRSSVMAVASGCSAKFLTEVQRPACVDLLFDHMVVL